MEIQAIEGSHWAPGMMIVPILAILVVVIVTGLLTFVLWGMIFRRAGYSFALAILMLIPLANVIWLSIFAFSQWPIQKELAQVKANAQMASPPPSTPHPAAKQTPSPENPPLA